jgi:hypothetical protein
LEVNHALAETSAPALSKHLQPTTNQPTYQPTNQPTKKPTNQPTKPGRGDAFVLVNGGFSSCSRSASVLSDLLHACDPDADLSEIACQANTFGLRNILGGSTIKGCKRIAAVLVRALDEFDGSVTSRHHLPTHSPTTPT